MARRVADNTAVQTAIATALKSKTGRDFHAVECALSPTGEPTGSGTCTAIESNGSRWEVEHSGGTNVILKDVALYAKTLETIVGGLARDLSKHYGLSTSIFPSGGALCGNMLRGKADESTQCIAVLADKSSTDVTVRTTRVEDNRIYFQMFPNNRPDLSQSGWHLADPR
ncbi:hypothetical protein [Nocardia sp. NPDC058705]|uniref:hypothetical protein n=1 Tax=Nocardia sp. NPDC058705 TaxID=3346609 RepID=UPI00367ED5C3